MHWGPLHLHAAAAQLAPGTCQCAGEPPPDKQLSQLWLLSCRGPGAGAEVTAGGVFSDLLRLAAYLGAPS